MQYTRHTYMIQTSCILGCIYSAPGHSKFEKKIAQGLMIIEWFQFPLEILIWKSGR